MVNHVLDDDEFKLPETLVLEKIKLGCSFVEDTENLIVLHDLRYEQRADIIAGRIVHQFRSTIYGRKLWEDKSEWTEQREGVPLTWWDHVKSALKKRWPRLRLQVAEREIETVIRRTEAEYHVCPHLALDSGQHFRFLSYDGSQGYIPVGLEDAARELIEVYTRARGAFSSPEVDHHIMKIRSILERARNR